MTWTTDDQAHYRRQKSALTRAISTARKVRDWQSWQRVIDVCDMFFSYYDNSEKPWPDAWSRWERARDDARHEIQRLPRMR